MVMFATVLGAPPVYTLPTKFESPPPNAGVVPPVVVLFVIELRSIVVVDVAPPSSAALDTAAPWFVAVFA
jgi:hypothetical protein